MKKMKPLPSFPLWRPILLGLVGALALLPLSHSFAVPPPVKPEPPNILFILIDTLRSDHLGCYGYSRPTSPHIDAIAKQGILFSNTFSIADWTNPAIASLFTGRFPQGVFPPDLHHNVIRFVLPEQATTLAEILKAAGYKTTALVAHPGINPKLGFAAGFEKYLMLSRVGGTPENGWPTVEADFVKNEFFRALELAKGHKQFLYLHLVYPHWPYTPPPPYATMFGGGYQKAKPEEKEGLINQYDGEIRYTDDLIGGLFEGLKTRGLLQKTFIVITSDHGEAFWEHGFFGHGNTYYNEEIKVPLILFPPGGRTKERPVVVSPVSTIDIFPTLLEVAAAGPHKAEGQSLSRFFSPTSPAAEDSVLFSESAHSSDPYALAVIRNSMKLIQTRQDLLFDLEKDPQEKNNLALEKNRF